MTPLNLDPLFKPSTLAIIGASKDESKAGGFFTRALLNDGYKGTLYPINPNEAEIMGLKSYPSVLEVPGEIDLAVFALQAKATLPAMTECSQKGVKFTVIHAAGFGELGGEGKALQDQVVEVARRGRTRVVGPNCMGVHSPEVRLNTIIPEATVPLPAEVGGTSFMGQSGWVTENLCYMGSERGLRFSKVISIGNQSDLSVEDFLGYFGADPQTEVILAYVEGFKRPREFLDLAKEIAPRKPVVIWKAGRSEAGARAVASHTGALAGNAAVIDAVFSQTGVTPANSFYELLDLAVAFRTPFLPRGNRLGLLVEAGGGGAAGADLAEALGLELPRFPDAVKKKIADFIAGKIPPSPTQENPVDVVWVPPASRVPIWTTCPAMVLNEVDILLMITYAPLSEDWFLDTITNARDEAKKPIFLVPGHPTEQPLGMSLLVQRGIPTFLSAERAVSAIAALVKRAKFLGQA